MIAKEFQPNIGQNRKTSKKKWQETWPKFIASLLFQPGINCIPTKTIEMKE